MTLFSYRPQKKSSYYYINTYKDLKQFFYGDFKNFFMQKNLKKVLGVDDLAILREWVDGKGGLLSESIVDRLIGAINPHYDNIKKDFDGMFNHPLEVVDEDGFFAGVFFGLVRVKKKEDSFVLSVRKNYRESADIRNEEDWVDTNQQNFIESRFLLLIENYLKGNSEAVINRLLMIATGIEFYNGNNESLSNLYRGKTAYTFFTTNNIKKYTLNDFKNTSSDLDGMMSYISGLILILMMNKDCWANKEKKCWIARWEREYPAIQKDSIDSINSFIDKMFCVKSKSINVEIYDGILSASYRSGSYKSSPLSKYIERHIVLEQYKEILSCADGDKQKIALLFAVLNNNKNAMFHQFGDDYFSYKKRITENHLEPKRLMFPSKLALRNFLALDYRLVFDVVHNCFDHKVNKYALFNLQATELSKKDTFWENLMFYLQHLNPNSTQLTYAVYLKVKPFIKQICLNFKENQKNENFQKCVAKAVELVIEMASLAENANLSELVDYFNGKQYRRERDGRLVRTPHSNLYVISKKTTLKHAMNLQHEWHVDVIEYEKQKNPTGEKHVRNEYKKLEPMDVVVDDVRFKLILNKSELRKETLLLNHCVVQYHNRIKTEQYIVIALTDLKVDSKRMKSNAYTAGFYLTTNGAIKIDQIKGHWNVEAPLRVKNAVNSFIKEQEAGKIHLFREKKKA
jgi:hypothetical protein